MTFKTEAERLAALASLPDQPNSGEHPDAFDARIAKMTEEIKSATIEAEAPAPTAVPEPPKAQEPAAPPAPPVAAQEPGKPNDEVVFTTADGKPIHRSELPEELRAYKNAHEIVKQFGHARKYANTIEQRFKEAQAEIERLKQSPAPSMAPQAPDYRTPAPAPEAQVAPAAGPVIRTQPQDEPVVTPEEFRAVEEIERVAAELEDPTVDPKTVGALKKSLVDLAKMAKAAGKGLALSQQQMRRLRDDATRQLDDMRSKLGRYEAETHELRERQAREQQTSALDEQISALQSKYPELNTSKKPLGFPNSSVESDALNFANKVTMATEGRQVRDWSEVNRIVNQWIREEPTLRQTCAANGIRPEDVGSNDNDFVAYATILNACNVANGRRVNEYTGSLETMVQRATGRPVTFPDAISAYEYLLASSGLQRKVLEARLAQAEQIGEKKVLSAVERQATRSKDIGTDGSTIPPTVSTEMSEEAARHLIENIDEWRMEVDGRMGNRKLFNQYNLARRRLGQEVVPAPDNWPSERQASMATVQ